MCLPKIRSMLLKRRVMVLAAGPGIASGQRAGSGVACKHEVTVLPRLAYLTVTNTFAMLRLLPISDRDKGRRDPHPAPHLAVPQPWVSGFGETSGS